MCLLDNREVRKGWQPLKEAVGSMFTKHGAEIVSARRWEERRLSYPIRGQQRGTYLLFYFKADTQQVAGIRRDLQFNESVLRSLLVTCEEIPQSAFEPEAAFDVNAIPTGDRAPEAQAPAAAAEPVGREPAEAADKALSETEETKA
jgi:ribosomal protein S6